MSAETDLQALLAADSAVCALVQTGTNKRIAADRMAQGAARPFVIYTRTGTEQQKGLYGTVFATAVTLEIQCWADTRADAQALGDAVQAAVEAGDNGDVVVRSGGYESDLDLEADILTITWWED